MPLNKLENFIKNTEGRILYVNPSDLDATDSIDNQGNSLTKPFKTIQRALIESARFSYLRGSNNDIVEKTTILLFPGEHTIDNRPGYAIKNVGGTATVVSPSGTLNTAQLELGLTLESSVDLTDPNNVLHKFNSIYGGVIVPRGTSIVGLDLRKTKIRPKYVPNPTDPLVNKSAIFRITGTCYFWQFSIFDGLETGLVYTDPQDFSTNNQSTPTFSHHKLTCFEYADGVNKASGYDLTDLDMYYAKLSNAFNVASGRDIDQKYPSLPLGFAKQRAEWEIVGAFASDPIQIQKIISGDGFTATSLVTVTTAVDHGFTAGTPIKIRGVSSENYNVSTKVQSVTASNQFTYLLSSVPIALDPAPSSTGATITIETDTVSGASPYIFNISLRSVWGMAGMHADGSKASGFRSMVVAQFTAVSLQKDDRAFVKYNETSRLYDGITVTKVTTTDLSSRSSSTDPNTVYHLDPEAIYRPGWLSSHIKMSNDAIVQIVSVFAIGFNRHFDCQSGGDASITNSNSNFGQFSLSSDGFKKEAFSKDDKGYITAIIPPRAITSSEQNIDWISFDVGLTTSVGISSHLYLFGFSASDDIPPVLTQGYRVGARQDDKVYVQIGAGVSQASLYMNNTVIGSGTTVSTGSYSAEKRYRVASGPVDNIFTLASVHDIQTGEKIRIISDNGDLPENITENVLYYAIRVNGTDVKLASSKTNADNGTAITVYGGTNLVIYSSVSDKNAGDVGHPIQYDTVYRNWYIHTDTNSEIYRALRTQGVVNLTPRTAVSYLKRYDDNRSLDDKLYQFQVVIPKEAVNSKNPTEGFIIQESSSTGARSNSDFTTDTITSADHDYNRNPRFISTCTVSSTTVTVLTDLPHDLQVGDYVIIEKVSSSSNTLAADNLGFNGRFAVTEIVNDKSFKYESTDVDGVVHDLGSGFTNNTNVRDLNLPRFSKNDCRANLYIYRSEIITPYIYNVQDGVYQVYVLNSSNPVETTFTSYNYGQSLNDFYPQNDKDNIDDNPQSAATYAKRNPLGAVVTNDLKKSITRETLDKLVLNLGVGFGITGVTTAVGITTIFLNKEHGFAGIVTCSTFAQGNGYNNGTFYNVKLFNNGTSTWQGATAKVTISSGQVKAVDIISGGSAYVDGQRLDFDTSVIGAGVGAGVTVRNTGITTVGGDVVQVTGIGTTSGGYYRVASVPAKNQVTVYTNLNTENSIIAGQYLVNVGPGIAISSTTYDATTGITTFVCSSAHGLLSGNSFRVANSSYTTSGNYTVKEKINVNTFTSKTATSLSSPAYIFKGFFSANDAEKTNFGGRTVTLYANDELILSTDITSETSFAVTTPNAGISTQTRFPVGSYFQVDNEIMRVTSSLLSGVNNNQISVARGVLGTQKEGHSAGSLLKKIRPLPVEFRRPSILRASGHTFEYLGYGPGNYSTGLPQVQTRTLTEREQFLAQAQESSAGLVVYTGMNNDGDFFIGNTKYSSASGEQTTFDIPTPTVTGQDSSRLSVTYDEVLVKERIRVEGGSSNTVLSQFDGPVTLNNEVKINGATIIDDTLKVTDELSVTKTTQSVSKDTGAVIIDGGVGIDRNVFVGENVSIAGSSIVTGISTFVGVVNCSTGATFRNVRIGLAGSSIINSSVGNLSIAATTGSLVAITTHVTITGILSVTDDITAFYSSDERLKDNITPIDDPLAKVLSISGNTFTWNDKSHHTGEDVGVVAQEVQKVLPQIVTLRDSGYLAVDYQKIVPLLIEAIKELNAKIERLEEKLSDK